jgi:hypothetical protein
LAWRLRRHSTGLLLKVSIMEQFATNVGATTVASTSVLALALGMGIGINPAQAALEITSFTQAENEAFLEGQSVTFGPEGGFTASLVGDTFKLDGLGNNKVAETGFTLEILQPGDVVDGSLNFDTFSSINLASLGDGTYYFGLNAIPNALPDPFGWIEISLDGDIPTLERFAFQDNPIDGAIIPSAIPEPAMLPLFAVGAAAVLAARRRRRTG